MRSSDFHEMCRYSSCVSSGNLVRLWQTILYDRGDLAKSGIDGTFEPNTEARP